MTLASGDCSGRVQLPDVCAKAESQVEGYRLRHADLIQRVVRLRDDDQKSFPRIAKALNIKEGAARHLYDLGIPDRVAEAARAGSCPNRGRYSHLGPRKYSQIRQKLICRQSVKSVALDTGVGQSTVRRELQRMRLEGIAV